MHVSIVGSGYVGTTVAACLADMGHEVVNVDIDEDIVDAINAGESPIHEPGLAPLIDEHAGVRLRATTDYDEIVDTDLTMLCLPTPQQEDGSLELGPMRAASESLGEALADAGEAVTGALDDADSGTDSHLVVVKSTVLPGTTEDVVGPIVAQAAGMTVGDDLDLAMNPEFLRMGTAVPDFQEPDKVVVGATSEDAAATLRDLYAPILEREGTDYVETDVRSAELIKYANNAFLASKVSLVNELGNIAKAYGADAYEVLDAVGLDDRISERFMRSGLGWGGSCFPKDVNALRAGARDQGYEPGLLDAVVAVNDGQPDRLVSLLADHVDIEDARIAVLGLSFKPHTDDIRKSRSLLVIDRLRERGADVVAHDPVAIENVREYYAERNGGSADSAPDGETGSLTFEASIADALAGVDGAVLATDWPEYDDLPVRGMDQRILVDGRRIDVDRDRLDTYDGLTW
ncbi:nucleotide sugar dehydrogenase [Halovivax ruber XH-70]|uniref:UDP-glucose 6-dehydrogenase n=1 Tax=Halovivax ruber (strain DSM 18193 / JCM 13892 / XH-70) TaxID=797302 RepID=L0IBM9_HALRX|nr:UDP-glucose/GDP-mannose dehydrogenase family protein [Halovivax ruber]AGB15651.1 nucleotide sugar dehydrogenase [Halovivax ruber XH-70]